VDSNKSKPIVSGALDNVSREDIESSIKKDGGKLVQKSFDLYI